MTPQQMRAQALAKTRKLPMPDSPEKVCADADIALHSLVDVTNKETNLLRAGKLLEASELAARKAELAQTYVGLARAIQSNAQEIKETAPHLLQKLQQGQAALATQMAENLRVLATAKSLTEEIVSSVASQLGQSNQTAAYGNTGRGTATQAASIKGVSVNTSL
ncbi:hypothetical protein [Maritalea porphyrae]|jgi:hypothetical protein|uniref:hypothetical protein n=1 Tax=Maritalea porphyrae TaxID=880732 RepID=UPI0022AEB649|nr:hypothetical protein [Maritalea porphyrae]MCZ4272694.1 hypothetical protein [Maritalea porphyrae]